MNFSNKLKIFGLGLSVLSTIVPAQAKNKIVNKKKNIILFLVDDMGWQDTSLQFWKKKTASNTLYNTPNMERLAKQGVKFTNAYACSVCTPSRVSLMSGMNAAHHRVTNWVYKKDKSPVTPPAELIMPKWNLNGIQAQEGISRSTTITSYVQILKNNGYKTIHCGKAHWGSYGTPGADPKVFGFDVNIGGHAAGAPGSYLGTDDFRKFKNGKAHIKDVPGLEKYHGKDIFLSEALTLEAIIAMDNARRENKPFYLNMSHYAIHTPIMADKRFVDKYRKLGIPEVEAKYASLIEGMDKSLGDILDFLDQKGISENTIIIFMSDNGGLSAHTRAGELHTHNLPLSSGKGSAREGGVREPMIVKWPGLTKENTTCKDYVIIEDFFPTILEMAEINNYKTIQKIDGQSFVPLLADKNNVNTNRAIYWHYPNNWGPQGPGIGASSAMRMGKWKLIYYHKDASFELFNLKKDIGETNNLALRRKAKLKKLATNLSVYLRSVDAQMPKYKSTGKMVPWPDSIQ